MLITMESMSINDDYRNVDAWCYVGSGSFSIVCIGPIGNCKYVLERGVFGSTAWLQNGSDSRNRISHITYTDEMGLRHYRYGRNNIKGIVGVAVAGRPSCRCSPRAPTTYVKIKWVDIARMDSILCHKCCSWITRSDFIRMVGRALSDFLIYKALIRQEERYCMKN